MLAITNAELVLYDHFLPEAVLFAENGVITYNPARADLIVTDGHMNVSAVFVQGIQRNG